MVKIRLTRVGRTKSPYYRLVVADIHRQRDGRTIEILGQYQPLKAETHVKINEDRALYWLRQGAQPSDTARAILKKLGLMQKYHESKVADRKAHDAAKAAAAG